MMKQLAFLKSADASMQAFPDLKTATHSSLATAPLATEVPSVHLVVDGLPAAPAEDALYELSTGQQQLSELLPQGEETSSVAALRHTMTAAAQSKLKDSLCNLPGYVQISDSSVGVLADAKTREDCVVDMTLEEHVILAARNASTSLTSLRGAEGEITWDSSADCHALSYTGHVIVGIVILVIAIITTLGNLLVLCTFCK
ncbi:hypothetical protein RRG08_021589 [Elysia crispata]|uniref:Uncharacterized protein n=1 Tax=Elysia crispata TaxID=231223 RepID=A0AAE0XDQ4_9GAST|nr:hypothetical protein RRG08_021589 [Elysia crispata]